MLRDNDDTSFDDEKTALPFVYGRSVSQRLTTSAVTAVTYHAKAPTFYDEINIRLPTVITPKHHLLCIFYHITVQKTGKRSAMNVSVCSLIISRIRLMNHRHLLGTALYSCVRMVK